MLRISRDEHKKSHRSPVHDEDDPSLGPVLDFLQMVWALDHALVSTSKRMKTEMGVTGAQRLVIRILGRFPGLSAGKLASIMRVHPSTLTGVLRRLESRKMIQRKADPEDARRAILRLTPKGEEVNTHKTGTVEAAVRRALSRASPVQLESARHVLQQLTDELSVPAE